MDPKPEIKAMVAWPLPDGDFIVRSTLETLDRAADFHAFGWIVWVDPWDQEALTRWEQVNRKPEKRTKW